MQIQQTALDHANCAEAFYETLANDPVADISKPTADRVGA